MHLKLLKSHTHFLLSLCQLSCLSLFFASCNNHLQRKVTPIESPVLALENPVYNTTQNPIFTETNTFPEAWWELFQDVQLNTFMQTLLEQNPTLQSAQLRIANASYEADRIKAALYPNILWGGDILREKFSKTGLIPFNSPNSQVTGLLPGLPVTAGKNGIPVYFTQFETQLTLSYDFDVWNKNRNTWIAALGEVMAKRADEAFTHLELTIALARVYFDLQVDYQRQKILQKRVDNLKELLKLNQQLVQGHLKDQIAVELLQYSLFAAEDDYYQVVNLITLHETQLKAYLAGDFNEVIQNIDLNESALIPFLMPVNLHLSLIARRPDITAQLWLIESAGKQIEVAKAGFYPDFNISALIGLQTIHLHKLFEAKSSYLNGDPAFTLPIFDGGFLRANLNEKGVDYDLAILHYNELILTAVKEVIAGIETLKTTHQQYMEAKNASLALEKALQLTDQKLQHNLAPRLDLLTSEELALKAKDREFVILGQNMQAILILIKAIGGGYNAYGGCNE